MKKETTKTILIVEDEKSYQDILLDKLGREGFNVVGAGNGQEGFKIAMDLHPDLIILDIEMPIVNGLAMLEKLRQEPWGAEAKVIMLTTYQDTDKISKAMNLGTYDYFVKTEIDIEDLVNTIKKKLS